MVGGEAGRTQGACLCRPKDNVIEAFRYTPDLLKSELETLTTACDFLNGFHVGLRHELAGGW